MDSIEIGDVSVNRIEEFVHWAMPIDRYFPGTDEAAWLANRDWLEPDHWDATSKRAHTVFHSWLIRSGGQNILVDTGVGNGKLRPSMPDFSMRQTPYLQTLESAGFRPDDIDLVICTHLHVDHVGWNTHGVDGEWVPTFPNARYVFARPEVEFWDPGNKIRRRGEQVNENVFDDSVRPILDAGLADVWDGPSLTIDENVRLELAPGHTPGLAVVKVRAGSDQAIFVNDILHSPMQVLDCALNSCFCEDEAESVETRKNVLGWAADNRALIFPAHFNGQHVFRAERRDGRFAIAEWI
ncbi:MBL fold metallo-hydrolase [Streptosporangium lutulentum]|uniref:Glyoxylase-like metal-dependent hydrolase (Beta-lactamase superfamily II) n=1 Tax=Streptosporangium lutulentum TaxID=1461250 RepID=A0ABT9QJT4_9ACTN|nr:MBL fold metallo-hydrolase [Streptosporangium lutulentum]MDP9847020.1 glyoxylase-like metal-dependent hydrolase (beta-lactamase superfamily II) [Streptosporangium lutulentum]